MTVMQQGDWRVASESEGESGSGGVERAGSYICMYVCTCTGYSTVQYIRERVRIQVHTHTTYQCFSTGVYHSKPNEDEEPQAQAMRGAERNTWLRLWLVRGG